MIPGMNEMANLVGGIGDNHFSQNFFSFCQDQLNVDQCTVFSFDHHGNPECLVAEAQHSQARNVTRTLAQEYTDGAFRRDPNIIFGQAALTPNHPMLVRCVSPAHIRDQGYRRRFYHDALVRQELALVTSIDDRTLYCSFYRSDEQRDFVHEDTLRLQYLGGFLAQTLSKHTQMLELRHREDTPEIKPATLSLERREKMYEDLRNTLLKATGGLTQREAQICASIALGYTTLGISLNLGISINTVATHRKRAYAKLGISCQNELFARYYDNMGGARNLN
ncbi:helix-turn-helix transcriptional regulator [Pseudomonas sp. BF-R-01]|jgi:DNA-binding CsgD family transcriptional regulator|uniref:helix-turn-helix transcriptional regulator n=1 Tax=Pseudomonas sp. BF-R-01 TaxID=2832365 RepID=UPI001CBBC779|nr:helix-turn-helix transcriptional regulator [Pseudomonas sp. BF-R-01]